MEIKRISNKQIPLPTLLEQQGDYGNAYDGHHGDRFGSIGYRSCCSALHWGGAPGHAGHDGVEFGSYGRYHSGMEELYGEEPFVEYSGHRGRGEFGLYEEYGSGMEPYRGEPSFEYSGHYRGHEFGRGVEPYRGEPPEHLWRVEGGQFGGYGGAMEYREEAFHEYSSHTRGGIDRGYDVQHGCVSHSDVYGEYGMGGIGRGGYRGRGGGGSSTGYRDSDGGGRRGRWYHPYSW